MTHTSSKKGATLLIAVIMASVMLSVGLGVYQRTYKELYFSSFWKQVQLAFAAADSGFECALYWDLHPPTSPAQASCSGGTPFDWQSGSWSLPDIVILGGGCAKVTITKPSPGGSSVRLESRGYNTCDTTNPRRVERGLRIDY